MPTPHLLKLSNSERETLQSLLRAASSPQSLAFRCRLVLRAADADQPSNIQIANEMGCNRDTVGTWRNRFRQQGVAGLEVAPRPGQPHTFPPEEQAHVLCIASSKPSNWVCTATRSSLDDIASTIIKEAYYQAISPSTIWRIRNDADLKPHRSVYWLNGHDADFDPKSTCHLSVIYQRTAFLRTRALNRLQR